MTWFRNLRISPKLIGSFILVAILAALVGGAGFMGLQAQNTQVNHLKNVSIPSVEHVQDVQADVLRVAAYSLAARTSSKQAEVNTFISFAVAAQNQAVKDWQAALDLPFDTSAEATLAGQTTPALQQWLAVETQAEQLTLQNTAASKAQAGALSTGPGRLATIKVDTSMDQMRALYQKAMQNAESSAADAYSTAKVELAIAMVLAMLLAIGLGWSLARSIARPLDEVQRSATALANVGMVQLAGGMLALSRGDLTVRMEPVVTPPTYTSKSEIGATAEAVRGICTQGRAAIEAYEAARAELSTMIGQVADSSEQVHSGSNQLAQASQQVGQASAQIAKSIEEVARGTSDQSRSASEIAGHMQRLSGAIASLVTGAERQQATAFPAAAALTEMGAAVKAAKTDLQDVEVAAGQAAATARDGDTVVGQTVSSIASVRAAVRTSAERVAALGKQSQEIGQIVDAIGDIAAQTNLLALNAAIEAARAGEHGKGFTVVAAEVRKLAERSASETKEITQRITAIQGQVAEVVAAMEQASAQVEESAALGDRTRSALASIVTVVEGTREQVVRISAANEGLARNVDTVIEMGEARNLIVAENGAATQVMQSLAGQVNDAVESIAAVIEQSAAGAEEVSASTEEQTASVEEMSAGAQELAAVANQLNDLVARFTVETAAAARRDTGSGIRTSRVA